MALCVFRFARFDLATCKSLSYWYRVIWWYNPQGPLHFFLWLIRVKLLSGASIVSRRQPTLICRTDDILHSRRVVTTKVDKRIGGWLACHTIHATERCALEVTLSTEHAWDFSSADTSQSWRDINVEAIDSGTYFGPGLALHNGVDKATEIQQCSCPYTIDFLVVVH